MLWELMLEWVAKCRCNCVGCFRGSCPRLGRPEPRHDAETGLAHPHALHAGLLKLAYKLTHMHYMSACSPSLVLGDCAPWITPGGR